MNNTWPQFRDYFVELITDENKWVFAGRRYKQRGQAEKAAWKEWRKTQ